MGVPVVTCPGETFASRHSLSHLANVGLEELVAQGPEDYVARAVRWATDLDWLSELRQGLRARVRPWQVSGLAQALLVSLQVEFRMVQQQE